MKNISAQEAWDLLKGDKDSLLVDVRTEAEWDAVGYPDLSKLGKDLIKLTWKRDDPQFIVELEKLIPNRDSKIIFICKAGGRSGSAANLAVSHGYDSCYNLIGGFEMGGWKDSKLPFKK
jgi:rhodanese-related sulfurtransferase